MTFLGFPSITVVRQIDGTSPEDEVPSADLGSPTQRMTWISHITSIGLWALLSHEDFMSSQSLGQLTNSMLFLLLVMIRKAQRVCHH